MTRRSRRGCDEPPSLLDDNSEVALSQLRRLALEQRRDSSAEFGVEALYWFAQLFAPPVSENPRSRESWLAILQWLDASMAFPAITELRAALEDLERGVIWPALQRPLGSGKGRRVSSSDEKLGLLRKIVEAANELGRRYDPAQRDEAIENTGGVKLETLRRWRQVVEDGPSRHKPRLAWHLHYGSDDPAEVMRKAASEYWSLS